jgi:hypothetical protein
MLKRTAPTTLVLTAAVAAATLALAKSGEARRSPICTRGNTTVEVDPRGLLPLTGVNPIAPATTAALRHTEPSNRPQVTSTILATVDRERGPQARFACGPLVWRRTVVVYIRERALLPAESASQRVFFVGRFRAGYRVWQVVH